MIQFLKSSRKGVLILGSETEQGLCMMLKMERLGEGEAVRKPFSLLYSKTKQCNQSLIHSNI